MLNPRKIILLDAVGALFSALLTGVILPMFAEPLGLSVWMLHVLAAFPLSYAAFGFTCYFSKKPIQAWMLVSLIAANSFYCVITGSLIFICESITPSGQLVLFAEAVTIVVLISLELIVYRRSFSDTLTQPA